MAIATILDPHYKMRLIEFYFSKLSTCWSYNNIALAQGLFTCIINEHVVANAKGGGNFDNKYVYS